MSATHCWLPRESKSRDSTKAHICQTVPSRPVVAKTSIACERRRGIPSSPAKLRELTGGVSKSF